MRATPDLRQAHRLCGQIPCQQGKFPGSARRTCRNPLESLDPAPLFSWRSREFCGPSREFLPRRREICGAPGNFLIVPTCQLRQHANSANSHNRNYLIDYRCALCQPLEAAIVIDASRDPVKSKTNRMWRPSRKSAPIARLAMSDRRVMRPPRERCYTSAAAGRPGPRFKNSIWEGTSCRNIWSPPPTPRRG